LGKKNGRGLRVEKEQRGWIKGGKIKRGKAKGW
jgi:hypothetical protein